MKSNINPENRRLLDALRYIDDDIISEVLADVKVPEYTEPVPNKKSLRKSIKTVFALAACMVLLGALFPTVSWLSRRFEVTAGTNPTQISVPLSRVIRNGYQVYGNTVYSEAMGWFEYYTPFTGDYVRLSNQKSGTDGDPYKCVEAISGIADGKLYYIYSWTWELYPDLRAAYLDLESGEAIEFCDMKNDRLTGYPYVCGDYYYYSIKNYSSKKGEIYRISLWDGKEEFFLELGEGESLFMAADGEIVTIYQHSLNTASGNQTRYVINAYDIENKSRRELWSDIDLSYSKIYTSAYLDGKLYFLAYNQFDNSNDILMIDVSNGAFQCVKSKVSSYWWLTDNGIYYFPYENRELNFLDPLSSVTNALYQTNASGTLCFCDLDGKNDRKIYTNEDIAINHIYDPILASGKLCARFYGDFPSLGFESAGILADIELDSGSMRRLNDPAWDTILNTETDPVDTNAPETEEEFKLPIPEGGLDFIEHVGEVPEEFKAIVANDTFGNLRTIGDKLYYIEQKDTVHYIVFVDKKGQKNAVKTAEAKSFINLFLDTEGNYLAVYSTGKTNESILVKFDSNGNIIFNTYCNAPVGSSLENMVEIDGGYVFVGGINVKSSLVNLTVSDIVISRISSDGVIEAYEIFGDNDYDTIRHVEKTQNGVRVYFNMRHRDETNPSSLTTSTLQRYDFDFNCNLKTKTEITEEAIPDEKTPYFTIDGKPYYETTDFFKDYDQDRSMSRIIIQYDDFVLLVYQRFTSDYRHSTNTFVSDTLPSFYYRERVYAAYSKNGELLWRTAVDATNYKMLKEIYKK